LEYAETSLHPNQFSVILGRVNGKTFEEIGKGLGISRERVRQIIMSPLSRHSFQNLNVPNIAIS